MKKKRLLGNLLISVLGFLVFCGQERTTPITNDKALEITAKLIPFNILIHDILDADKGNQTDFRYIVVHEKGGLTISAYFENPNIPGTVTLLNAQGQTILTKNNGPGSQQEKMTIDASAHDKYYLKFHSKIAKASYSVIVTFKPSLTPKPKTATLPPLIIDEPPIPKKSPAPLHTKVFWHYPIYVPKPKPVTQEKPKKKTISGKIVLLVTQSDGSVLHINLGQDDHVKVGDTGIIKGIDNGFFQITEVLQNRSIAFTKAKMMPSEAIVSVNITE